MNEKDILTEEYLSVNERFADAVNVGIFKGKQVVVPEQIREIDGTSKIILKSKKRKQNSGKANLESGKQYRDILRKVIYGANFCIVGIEDQSDVHYVFPIRAMLYDAAAYKKQWNQIKRMHKEKKDLRGAEFLSGFSKNDTLKAVVTLVVYYGTEPWDGAKDIHSLIDWSELPEEFKEIVPNYSIYLLELNNYKNLDDFKSDLKTVCRFLQNCNDAGKLEKMLTEHRGEFENLEEDTYDLIGVLGDMSQVDQLKEECRREEGRYNMCKGMEDWLERKKNEGVELGRSEGLDEGARNKLREQIEKKLAKGKTPEEIADALEESVETVLEVMKEIKSV